MSKSKYPLCEALGINTFHHATFGTLVSADELEKCLREAPVVECPSGNGDYWYKPTPNRVGNPTHTARLLCIQPIKKDTAEDILRELVDIDVWHSEDFREVRERAKKVLGE